MTNPPRLVTFDVMSEDPDYYFVLTEALRDFAARELAEAKNDPERAAACARRAAVADDALWRIEMALTGNDDGQGRRAASPPRFPHR